MNIPEILLAVCILILLWRVWRLETRAQCIENNAAWLRDCIADRPHKAAVNALSERVAGDLAAVHQLARALGYEWKRTDAKEGWEKKVTLAEALKETCGGGTPFASSFRTVHYDDIPKYTLDRRKADRRKPLYTAQDAKLSSAGLGARKPAKKRRAH